MNVILPPTSPQILTEAMFIQHGFFTGSATNYMIQAAFSIAENQVARDIGTFLAPTTFTGTYTFLGYEGIYESPVGKVIEIPSVTIYERYTNSVDRLISGTSIITDPDNGYFLIRESEHDNSHCEGCSGEPSGLYKFEIVIKAGYPEGVIENDPLAKLALCMAADIVLKMMYDEGIGVQYENLTKTLQVGRVIQTFEHKGLLGQTIFGPSSRGHYIHNLLNAYRITKAGKLGR